MRPLRRIFSLVTDCHAPSGYSSPIWNRHIYQGLRKEVELIVTPQDVDFGWAWEKGGRHFRPNPKAMANTSQSLHEQIQAAHRQHRLDAVISYSFAEDIEVDLVRKTIASGIPWINFFCDSTHMFSHVEALAREVSLNWFVENAAIPRYRALGKPFLCAPYAFNPDFLPDLTCRQPKYAVGFAGMPTSNRITELGWLSVLGCPVTIIGRGWIGESADPFFSAKPLWQRVLISLRQPHFLEKIIRRFMWPRVRPMALGEKDEAGFNQFLSECQILLGLNIGRDESGRLSGYLKFRDIEFPGYGCCYLTQHNQDIPLVFEIGKEVLTFRSIYQASRLIRHLLKNPEERAEIATRGRRKVLSQHTWARRLQQLSQALP